MRLPAKIKSIVGPGLLLCGSEYVKKSFSSDCKITHYIFNNRRSEKKSCLCDWKYSKCLLLSEKKWKWL